MGRSARPGYTFDTVSPSQMKQFELCPRRWFFAGPLGMKFKSTKAMRYSSKCHADAEKVLRAERDIPETAEVAELMDRGMLPHAEDKLVAVEQEIDAAEIEMIDGVLLTGTTDAAWWFEWMTRPDPPLVVTDWKFRSNTGNVTEEDIRENVQLHCYADGLRRLIGRGDIPHPPAMTNNGNRFESGDFGHFVLQQVEVLKEHKGGPAARCVSVERSHDEIDKFMDRLRHTVHRMNDYAKAHLAAVPQDFDACYAYGKCQYYDRCRAVEFQPVSSSHDNEEQPMDDINDFLDGLDNPDGNATDAGGGGGGNDDSPPQGNQSNQPPPPNQPAPQSAEEPRQGVQGKNAGNGTGGRQQPAQQHGQRQVEDPQPAGPPPEQRKQPAQNQSSSGGNANYPDQETRPTQRLAQAKTDWQAGYQQHGDDPELVADFDLADYDLPDDLEQQFGQWRKRQLADDMGASDGEVRQAEQQAPTNDTTHPATAPDQAPDEEPTGTEVTIQAWDWTKADKIGSATMKDIKEWFEGRPYDTLDDLLNAGFNFKQLPGVGDTTAGNIRDAMESEINFTPDNADGDAPGGGGPTARDMQKLLRQARDMVEEEGGYEWNSDLIDQDDVKACNNARQLADRMIDRIDAERAETAGTGVDPTAGTAAHPDFTKGQAERSMEQEQAAVDNANTGEHGWTGEGAAPEAQEALANAGADDAERASDVARNEVERTKQGIQLFINCRPVQGTDQPVHLHAVLEEVGCYDRAVEKLRDNDGIETEIEYWNAAPYGKGKQALAGAVLERLDQFDGRTIVADDDMPGAKEVLPLLMSRADIVVKAG